MTNHTQLLCTFTTPDLLNQTLADIRKSYTIAFKTIYIFESVEDPTTLYCTYNIDTSAQIHEPIPANTISVHRKKATNTIYTINALNAYIVEHHGSFNSSFPVPWDTLKNSILVTAYGQFKQVELKIKDIIRFE